MRDRFRKPLLRGARRECGDVVRKRATF